MFTTPQGGLHLTPDAEGLRVRLPPPATARITAFLRRLWSPPEPEVREILLRRTAITLLDGTSLALDDILRIDEQGTIHTPRGSVALPEDLAPETRQALRALLSEHRARYAARQHLRKQILYSTR